MEPQSKAETTEQQSQLTPELVQELVTLMKEPKIQVKHGALNVILQHTKTENSKELFIGTDLFSEINKVINHQKLTKICLSTLINFGSCQSLEKEFARFVEPLIFNLKEWKDDLREELALLVLLNITKFDSVIEEIINKGQKRGFMSEVLYGFMQIKENRRWVITNIFVNVSSVDYGRRFIAEQKIYLRFLNFMNHEKEAVRIGVIKIFRNVSFEWEIEQFITEMLKPQHDILNKLAEHMAYVIIVGKLSSQTSDQEMHKLLLEYQPVPKVSEKIIKEMKVASKEKTLGEICLVIDTLLILSNCNFTQKKASVKQGPMREILSILRFTGLTEEYKDKLDALETFGFV